MYYIYCIFSVNHIDSYIGHTSNIKRRMANHKQRLKTESHLKIYQFINSIGWNSIQYSILETIESDDRVIARQRERFWIDTMTPNLNKCLPCRSQKEYQQDNKEKLKFRRNIQNISKRKERTKFEFFFIVLLIFFLGSTRQTLIEIGCHCINPKPFSLSRNISIVIFNCFQN